MQRSSQQYYISGSSGSRGILAQIFAFVVGVVVLGVAIFLGALFIAAIVGFILIGSVLVAIRMWWVRRQMERFAREHGDIDAEYTVVDTDEERRR